MRGRQTKSDGPNGKLPRRKQPAITIRSSYAAERLRLLTRDGRTQAEVIEAMPLPIQCRTPEERVGRMAGIVAKYSALPRKTMAALDAEIYDEEGLPR